MDHSAVNLSKQLVLGVSWAVIIGDDSLLLNDDQSIGQSTGKVIAQGKSNTLGVLVLWF